MSISVCLGFTFCLLVYSLVCKLFLFFFCVCSEKLTFNNFLPALPDGPKAPLAFRLHSPLTSAAGELPRPLPAPRLPSQRCQGAPRLARWLRTQLPASWGRGGGDDRPGSTGKAPPPARSGRALGTGGGPAAPPGPRAPRPGGEGLAHCQRLRAGPLPRPARSQPGTPAGPT